MNYSAGDIVVADYVTFNSMHETGLFLIVYSEDYDNSTLHKQNYVGMKLTTSPLTSNPYGVGLRASKHSFLNKDCVIMCNRPHVLDGFTISRYLGTISGTREMYLAFETYYSFNFELTRQLMKGCRK